ncbi:S24 family peptidase [Tenacibaculum maritimum]|nr:S24 family peptidase [Tenacibaculum maritimum]MDB0612446.1 S24 family peptidase [Tenacibaculum maritimum]
MKGLEFKEIRKRLEYTQIEMGKVLSVTRKTIGEYEKSDLIPDDKAKFVTMLLEKETKGYNENKNTEAIPVDFTEMNIMFVPLVSKFAYAGYLDNLGDDEYLEELPKIPFANDVQNRGDYLCFEVKGDSMESDTPDTILEGDVLLCRNVRQDYWKSKLHINKWDFVIVHKERGILIKRITEHNTETHELTLHSLNDYYDDFKIHLKDVQAIFNVVDLRRKRNRR